MPKGAGPGRPRGGGGKQQRKPPAKTALVKAKKSLGADPVEMTMDEYLYQAMVRMCRWQATRAEVEDVTGLRGPTLTAFLQKRGHANWSAFFARYRTGGKISLRRAQYTAAVVDRNPTLLVWLGKQHLDQTDKRETKIVSEQRVTLDASKLSDDAIDQLLDAMDLSDDDRDNAIDGEAEELN